MGKVLRTLHVGVGGRGLWPVQLCRPEVGFQPVGLCDTQAESLAAARALTGVPATACFSDLDAMIRSVAADALIICTPTVTHVPYTRAAIAAGLAVLTEKGMAPDWASATGLVSEVQRTGSRVCVAQNYRYRPLERTIYKALTDPAAADYVGAVYWADYIEHRVRPEPRTLSYPFASIWDMSCHHFDNMISWFGRPESVTGIGTSAPWSAYKHPNNTAAILRFGGVAVVYGHTHDAARAELRIRLQGERGALFATQDTIEFNVRPTKNFGVAPVQAVPIEGPAGELGVLADFHRYIVDGIEPGISARQNLEVMALCQMLVLAIESGRTVRRDELA